MNRASIKLLLTLCVLAPLSLAHPAKAQEADFANWLQNFALEAAAAGVSESTIQAALPQIEFLPDVIRLDGKQPEKSITFDRYTTNTLPAQRIRRGRELYDRYRADLKKLSDQYGVPGKVVVALWGMESSYGDNMGGYDVISSLATLAYEGRRAEFFKTELLKAFQILDAEHIELHQMRGSWAGAMGQCQFMPSSFLNFAVDGNGDGKRDIWGTPLDVFASAANYLKSSGWKRGESWGREVRPPANLDASLIGLQTRKKLSDWATLGFRREDGSALPSVDIEASLVMPDGPNGRAFLVYDNYRIIMKWNRSTYFATSVGLLSDMVGE